MIIKTSYDFPPIPDRNFDWAAWNDDACGCAECHQPIGRGATEAAAIADFVEQSGLVAALTVVHARRGRELLIAKDSQ